MIFILKDVDGNQVTIHSEQIGSILSPAYFGEYDGEDDIEAFIEWFNQGCPDNDEDDE